MKTFADIKDKSISVGLLGSGTAQTATTLYHLMFGQAIPEQNVQHLSNEDALAALIVKKVDVAIIVVGQPAKLFNDMNPELLQQIRPLKVDPNAPETTRAKQTYFPTTTPRDQLSELAEGRCPHADGQGLSRHLRLRSARYRRQSESLCGLAVRQLRQSAGAWASEVEAGEARIAGLGKGWQYYPPVEKRLKACVARRASMQAAGAAAPQRAAAAQKTNQRPCSDQERLLLLCGK